MSGIAKEKFALDSCMISFELKGNDTVTQNSDLAKQNGHIIEIPPVAYYEVKRGFMAINATRRLRDFAELCEKYTVGQMDNSILEEAASIYAELNPQGINIDDNDLFIAAYCKVHGLTLVTNNTKHFGVVSGLSLTDWSV
jgi:predicted nucleic acid-binding protein